MQKIRLGHKGIKNISIMSTLGPLAEAIFSVWHMATRREPVFEEWREQVSRRLRSGPFEAGLLAALCRMPDLTWLLAEDDVVAPGDRHTPAGLNRHEVRAMVEGFAEISVIPYWRQMLVHLSAEREGKMREYPDGGEKLLSALHPEVRWSRPVLEVPGKSGDIELRDTGLLVAPSLFLGERPAQLLHNVAGTGGRPVLVYSVKPLPEEARALWTPPAKDGEALDALMGRTRAQLLRLTLDGGTTSELARLVGTSAAAVSQHTGILRKAGLIRSERDRNTVTHHITSLGRAMVSGALQPVTAQPAFMLRSTPAGNVSPSPSPSRHPFSAPRKKLAPVPIGTGTQLTG